MTQARKSQAKQPRAAAIKTKKEPIKVSGEPVIDESRFADLWARFEDEAGLTRERLGEERQKLLDELAALQAKINEKQAALDDLDGREEAAKQQMRMLLGARLSEDAILSAMRVEYKVRKPVAKTKKSEPVPAAGDDDKTFVLDHLDTEGLSVADLKKITDKDARFLRAVLESLVEDGRVSKTGDRASAKYHLA